MPAFLISGAIAALLDRESILRFFGPGANKWIAISVASIAGAILAAVSYTHLDVYKRQVRHILILTEPLW